MRTVTDWKKKILLLLSSFPLLLKISKTALLINKMKIRYCISSAALFHNLFDTVFLFKGVGRDFLLFHGVEEGNPLLNSFNSRTMWCSLLLVLQHYFKLRFVLSWPLKHHGTFSQSLDLSLFLCLRMEIKEHIDHLTLGVQLSLQCLQLTSITLSN